MARVSERLSETRLESTQVTRLLRIGLESASTPGSQSADGFDLGFTYQEKLWNADRLRDAKTVQVKVEVLASPDKKFAMAVYTSPSEKVKTHLRAVTKIKLMAKSVQVMAKYRQVKKIKLMAKSVHELDLLTNFKFSGFPIHAGTEERKKAHVNLGRLSTARKKGLTPGVLVASLRDDEARPKARPRTWCR